jgi:hypothetical protein
MSELQPSNIDAILGGQNRLTTDIVVLGGIEGIEQHLTSQDEGKDSFKYDSIAIKNLITILNENLDLSSLLFAPSEPLRLKNLGNHLLPSRQKNIDKTSILLRSNILFLNRRGAESAEGIKKRLIYSLEPGRE